MQNMWPDREGVGGDAPLPPIHGVVWGNGDRSLWGCVPCLDYIHDVGWAVRCESEWLLDLERSS